MSPITPYIQTLRTEIQNLCNECLQKGDESRIHVIMDLLTGLENQSQRTEFKTREHLAKFLDGLYETDSKGALTGRKWPAAQDALRGLRDPNAKDNAVQQAKGWAQEARTQRAIVMDIGKLVGCQYDWQMVGAVKKALVSAAQNSSIVQDMLKDAHYWGFTMGEHCGHTKTGNSDEAWESYQIHHSSLEPMTEENQRRVSPQKEAEILEAVKAGRISDGRNIATPEQETCKECGSNKLEWSYHHTAKGNAPDGRLRLNEVDTWFSLGCTECSETVRLMHPDVICHDLNNQNKKVYQCPRCATSMDVDQSAKTKNRLMDPATVHTAMLRGEIAKPSIDQIKHLYPELNAGDPDDVTQEMITAGMAEWDRLHSKGERNWPNLLAGVFCAMQKTAHEGGKP